MSRDELSRLHIACCANTNSFAGFQAIVKAACVVKHIRAWGIHVDDFFMGGADKSGILAAFHSNIYFDDQEGHCKSAAEVVSTARVPIPLTVLETPPPNSKPQGVTT